MASIPNGWAGYLFRLLFSNETISPSQGADLNSLAMERLKIDAGAAEVAAATSLEIEPAGQVCVNAAAPGVDNSLGDKPFTMMTRMESTRSLDNHDSHPSTIEQDQHSSRLLACIKNELVGTNGDVKSVNPMQETEPTTQLVLSEADMKDGARTGNVLPGQSILIHERPRVGKKVCRSIHFDKKVILFDAAARGDQDELVKLLDGDKTFTDAYNSEGNTALHYAASHGQVNAARILLTRHANVNAANEDGWTPLHTAASTGCYSIVNLLIKAGGNVEAPTDKGHLPADLTNNHDILALLRETIRKKMASEWVTGLYDFGPDQEVDCTRDLVKMTCERGDRLRVLDRETFSHNWDGAAVGKNERQRPNPEHKLLCQSLGSPIIVVVPLRNLEENSVRGGHVDGDECSAYYTQWWLVESSDGKKRGYIPRILIQ